MEPRLCRVLRRAAVLAAALGLAACAAPGSVSVDGSVSQRLEAHTNRALDGEPSPVFGSTTRAGLTTEWAAKRTTWKLETGVTASKFAGPGETDGLDRIDPDIRIDVSHLIPRGTLTGGAAFDIQPTSVTQVEDTGVINLDTAQISVQLSTGLVYLLDARNRLTLDGTAAVTRFTERVATLTPTTSYGLTGGWRRQMTPRTAATMSLGLDRFAADNAENERSLTASLSGRVEHAVNARLSGSAGIGADLVRRSRVLNVGRDVDLLASFRGDFSVAWLPAPDLSLSLDLGHGIQPSSAGALQTVSTTGLGVTYVVNDLFRTGLAMSYSRRAELGGNGDTRNLFTLTPSLSVQLDPHWQLDLNYILRMVDQPGNQAVSNAVTLNLSRSFEVVP